MMPWMIARAVLGGLWKRLTALFGWVADNPAKAALIAALIGLYWQHGALQGVRRDLVTMTQKRDKVKSEYAVYQNTVKKASDAAIAKAKAEKQRKEAEYERIANTADQAYDDLRARYRAVLVRTNQEYTSSASGSDLPGAAATPSFPPESASPTGFYISGDDALKCADLGAYAMGAYRWAEDVAKSAD